MKQFIVLMAVLPLMLIFMSIFVLDSSMNAKIDMAEDIVYTYKELARQHGEFTSQLQSDMRDELETICGEGVVMNFSDGIKYRYTSGAAFDDCIIEYSISVPVSEMSSIETLLGFKDGSYLYTISGYVASELLESTP